MLLATSHPNLDCNISTGPSLVLSGGVRFSGRFCIMMQNPDSKAGIYIARDMDSVSH
jgi:hypothetical protein